MGVLHFLNVNDGDCSIIQHPSGRVSVIDVNNASVPKPVTVEERALATLLARVGVPGNFQQKDHPVNPIEYLRNHGIESVFRFILTHADMDHMGGIKAFFETFAPANFWDTANTVEKEFDESCPHDVDDWNFYKNLRDTTSTSSPKRLVLYAGTRGEFYNKDGDGGGDGLHVLSPTPEICQHANDSEDCNDGSYVLLYRSAGGRILFGGDSHDLAWEHILKNYKDDVANVDLLIAPHHGRKSDRSYDFLDVLKPKMTFFGNASSEHLAYDAWYNRGLPIITNNQANCMVVDANDGQMNLYVTNKAFAEKMNPGTSYSDRLKAWFCKDILAATAAATAS